MGKGETVIVDSCTQESGMTSVYSQKQVIASGSLPYALSPNLLVTPARKEALKSTLIVPGFSKTMPTKMFASKRDTENLAFPDYSMPLSMFEDANTAFSDSNETFTRILYGRESSVLFHDSTVFIDVKKVKCLLRQCPGGRNGNTSGNGVYGSSSNGSGAQAGSGGSWVLGGGGGLSGGFGGAGAGGGGGDDDPWKNTYNNFGQGPAESFMDDDDFNSFAYLDEAVEDFLRDMPFALDLVTNQPNFGVGFNRDPSIGTFPSEEPSDPPSTPAPHTPLLPMTPAPPVAHTPMVPMTPPSVSNPPSFGTMAITQVNSPPSNVTCVQPSDKSDTQTLLDIQKLMISSSTTLIPQPSVQPLLSDNALLHQNQPTVRMPLTSQPVSSQQPTTSHHHQIPQQQQQQQTNVIDFLASKAVYSDKFHVNELFVPSHLPREKSNIGYKALQHCYNLYLRYQEALKNTLPSELPVAVQKTAHLCSMQLADAHPKICFELPKTCVPLNQWSQSSGEACDIAKRQLVLQQLINTLVILFKAPEELCFWGSAQLWVDTNMRVYLYVDFINSLAVQKEYADSGAQINTRVEDCKMLGEVYNTILKPFLHRDMTWVSPQLSSIFCTFEELLGSPMNCVSNMARVARVLGERRICKLEAANGPFQYTVYCAEHEPIAASLEVVSGVLPASVARVWAVLHSNGHPVGATEMATKQAQGSRYHLYPVPDGQCRFPGALYIESKQYW